jgi:predicted 2-oxoglutarate/Fe(II)-dependent dioxygenase YbiX
MTDTAAPRPRSGADIADYIVHLGGALPRDYCQAVLQEYRDGEDWKAARLESHDVRRDVRDTDVIALSDRNVIARNRGVRQRLDETLVRHTGEVLRRYHAHFPRCQVERGTGFELLRYRTGGFYRQHTDSFHHAPRELACSFLLNDDFEGGEFAFFDRTRRFAMRQGDAILFPANFMYPHEIVPVTAGVRYAIVTWFV